MASATLTILGLYNWQKDHDEDLFSELMIPEDMNKDVLVNNILMEAAPFEVYYPDPDIMEQAIGFWSKANIYKWNKWADSWEKAAEFNQLENFDRTEHEEITHSGQDDVSNTQTRNLSGSDNRTVNLTDEHKVSAYDSGSYAPKDQDLHTGTDNHALTDGGTVKDEGSTEYGHEIERNARYHGNIGVTSLAQLLEGYNEAAEKWDLYERITQEFIKEFCILVY